MKGKSKRQGSFFAGPIYDRVVANDHLLRRLRELIDWEALVEGVSDCYADVGRPSWPPEQMLKIMILQFIYDRSDRQIEDDLGKIGKIGTGTIYFQRISFISKGLRLK